MAAMCGAVSATMLLMRKMSTDASMTACALRYPWLSAQLPHIGEELLMNTGEKTGAAVPADVVETAEVVGYAGDLERLIIFKAASRVPRKMVPTIAHSGKPVGYSGNTSSYFSYKIASVFPPLMDIGTL
ncbi:hypothetical protein BJX66DRAFT_333160 [Aspergillus keveii]|uniref:Uncharacterized protein n=1 Tax=Aspergillus keveii TaxID=714993 RepID=A0ABR4GJM2_9EURO